MTHNIGHLFCFHVKSQLSFWAYNCIAACPVLERPSHPCGLLPVSHLVTCSGPFRVPCCYLACCTLMLLFDREAAPRGQRGFGPVGPCLGLGPLALAHFTLAVFFCPESTLLESEASSPQLQSHPLWAVGPLVTVLAPTQALGSLAPWFHLCRALGLCLNPCCPVSQSSRKTVVLLRCWASAPHMAYQVPDSGALCRVPLQHPVASCLPLTAMSSPLLQMQMKSMTIYSQEQKGSLLGVNCTLWLYYHTSIKHLSIDAWWYRVSTQLTCSLESFF